jgi:hypothetical protein
VADHVAGSRVGLRPVKPPWTVLAEYRGGVGDRDVLRVVHNEESGAVNFELYQSDGARYMGSFFTKDRSEAQTIAYYLAQRLEVEL